MFKHGAGDHCGKHQHKQPNDTIFRQGYNGHFQIRIVAVRNTGHHFKVLGVRLLHHVHRVVDGNDAHKPFFLVHNRK